MCGQGHLYLPPHSGFSDHQDGRAKFPNDVGLDMVSDPEGLSLDLNFVKARRRRRCNLITWNSAGN